MEFSTNIWKKGGYQSLKYIIYPGLNHCQQNVPVNHYIVSLLQTFMPIASNLSEASSVIPTDVVSTHVFHVSFDFAFSPRLIKKLVLYLY